MRARRLIIITAPKGGAGKTHIAKLIYDLLPEHGRSIAAWDLDASTGTFAVYHDGIQTFDPNARRSALSWFDDCYRDDIDDVVVDVPGGRLSDVLDALGEGTVADLVRAVADANREFVVVNPIGVMIAETITAQVTLRAFAGTTARVVIVKNGRFGERDDFVIYDGVEIAGERRYGSTRVLAEQIGSETLFLPCLAPRLLAQVDAEQLRLVEGAKELGIARFGRLAATRLQMYLRATESAFCGSSLDLDGHIPARRGAA